MMEQLVSVSIESLFGRFDHQIKFSDNSDILIVTAPNGYGKTVLLKVINSFFRGQLLYFNNLQFSKIKFVFGSGKSIVLLKSIVDLLDGIDLSAKVKKTTVIESSGFGSDADSFAIPQNVSPGLLRRIERESPVTRMEEDLWYDYAAEEVVSSFELVVRYGANNQSAVSPFEVPNWLESAMASVNTHLVETQRLLSLREDVLRSMPRHRRETVAPISTVDKNAKDLSRRITKAVSRYATISQRLDESFPKRLIESRNEKTNEESYVRRELGDLNDKQAALREVGLITTEASGPLSLDSLLDDDLIRKVLSINIKDTEEKLEIFDQIYEQISLFKEILDAHLSFKSVLIDEQKGMAIIDSDSGDEIPLTELSSGEQHELVLIYELIFQVDDGALILIDEPELSLHVAWQKKFIPDLQKIKKIRDLSVIIATHSPQIINDDWDLVHDLSSRIGT